MTDMRKLIEAVEAKEITEGRYGPHGLGRRVNDAVDAIFDRHLDRLGNDPTVEEIYEAMRQVRRDLADQELMGFPRTNDYINKQFLGAVAEKLELPGLYSPSGRVFYSVEKDDAGRYTGSGGASRRVAQELAEKGYLSQEAAERLGVTNFLGIEIGDRNSDSANTARNAQTMAAGRRQIRRDVARFLELLGKRNEGNDTTTEGVALKSFLGRLLTEALTDAEEREFQELLSKIKDLPADEYQDDEATLNAVQDAQERIREFEASSTASTEPAAPTDPAQDDADSRDNGAPEEEPAAASGEGMTLQQFAQSGKGGIKNDPGETRAITQLQEFLKTMGWDIGVDGRYGPQTTSAVKEFQQLVGLTDDGDAGPQTIEKILVWGRLPDVKTWSAQLKELNDLIEAGAVFQAPSNESVIHSIRAMINLVESLTEEVTDQQQARAMELYNALKAKLEDGEYQSGLPQELQAQFSAIGNWARATPAAADDTQQAAQPTITPERAGEIARDFARAGGLGSTTPGTGTLGHPILGHSTDEEGIKERLQELQNPADWQLVVDAYRDAGNRGGRLRSGNLIQDMMGSLDAEEYEQYVASELRRIGITPGRGAGQDDEAAPAADQSSPNNGRATDPSGWGSMTPDEIAAQAASGQGFGG